MARSRRQPKKPARKSLVQRVWSNDQWTVGWGRLVPGPGRPPGRPRLFSVVGEKLPIEALSAVRDDLQAAGFRTEGIYVAHDSMGYARYVGRGQIFTRLKASLLVSLLSDDTADYTRAFCNIDWEKPDASDIGATTRYDRRVAAYKACLHAAGFKTPANERVKFQSSKEIREAGIPGLELDPSKGISLADAQAWFAAAWDNYRESHGPFEAWRQKNSGRDWADEDLQTLMRFLTRKSKPGGNPSESGYRKLIRARELHTDTVGKPFEDEIVELLRKGKIVIIDLSQGDPQIQQTYSDRVCRRIFNDAIGRFIANEAQNFIQMYFEEAHNLFPRRDEKDLTLIYNRLAKEGQKLGLGLNYATQEVSSISSSILKNTQNWFVSHLNNKDELREVEKFYDFEDFTDSLRRTTDQGFIRMKTASNTFIVPVQIDRFFAGA